MGCASSKEEDYDVVGLYTTNTRLGDEDLDEVSAKSRDSLLT